EYIYDAKTPFVIYFISVGDSENQGDAILIRKGDLTVLIDAGPEKNVGNVVNFLNSKGVDTINILVSTVVDPEHYGGMNKVVDNFNVQEFWWSGNTFKEENYTKLINKIKQKGITDRLISRGEEYDLNGLKAKILNPSQPQTFTDVSNNAIAMKLTQNNFCATLTSDMLFGAQAEVLNLNDPKCSILQIPYHGLGKGTAQIDFLLLKVNPKDAIISGGIEDPSPGGKGSRYSVLEKMRVKGIKVYQNYVNGTVRITSDAISYQIDYVK
ncbi:MBL fold metallo-hydrolase, partial [Candidatus Micrarchaeota archaeon]|nr:MBL fold metallo-hydrolase [Candidatus Micrarchaeota archaeon]